MSNENRVGFVSLTREEYQSILDNKSTDDTVLYFATDTGEFFKGDKRFGEDLLSWSDTSLPVKFVKGNQSEIDKLEIQNGRIYFATDCGSIAYDLYNQRLWVPKVKSGNSEYWNSNPSFIPRAGEIIVVTDGIIDGEDKIPGVKIGNGTSVFSSLPFITQQYALLSSFESHANNEVIHVTQQNKDYWNNKMRCYLNENDTENLVFTD